MGKQLNASSSHTKDTASLKSTKTGAADPTSSKLNDKRSEIIREAYKVFYKEGFHAAGVDRLLEGTGISKRTLYKYFDSKEDLIEATIAHYGDQQERSLKAFFAESKAKTPIDRALSIFDWLEELIEGGHSFGCFAVNAKIEYTQKGAGIEAACDLHFARFENLFIELCRDCKAKNVRKTACQLRTIVQGAMIMGQTTGSVLAIQNAKAVARLLLENSI